MKTVRAKLRVSSVAIHEFSPHARTVEFTAEYDQSVPEEQRFQKATPSASAKMVIDNPAIVDFFTPGKKFYVDFTPAE